MNMQVAPKKRIGIIGGGVSGLVAAKAFKSQGHDVVVFERSTSIGGVWSPHRSYPGIKTQSPKDLYRFTDMAMPDDYPEWPSGDQVLAYLQSYAEKHELMKVFRFGTSAVAMKERSDGQYGWELHLKSSVENNDVEYKMKFDFVVVCTGTFTNPRTIYIDGEKEFVKAGGVVKHSSKYKDISDQDLKDKHVVIIGGSKSATDIAVNASTRGTSQVKMVYRRNVWRVPYFVAAINFKHLLYMRAQEVQFPSWKASHASGVLYQLISLIATPFVWLNFRMLELLLKTQLGLHKWNMVPSKRIEESVSCDLPIVTEGFFESLNSGKIIPVHGTADSYQVSNKDGKPAKSVLLSSGDKIDKVDIVIQATGWTLDMPFLPDYLKRRLQSDDGLFRLYRFAINPDLPGMGFVGLNSSFCSVLSSEMIANWLVRYVDGMLANQTPPSEMEENIDQMLEWKRTVYPPSKAYSGNCIAPFHHAHFDDILDDIGASMKNNSMFTYPCAEKYGKCLDSAPRYLVAMESEERSSFDEKKTQDL